MNADMEDVYALYVDVIIHDSKTAKADPKTHGQWVTSETATWY